MAIEIVLPSAKIVSVTVNPAALLEMGARICHKSESKGTPTLQFLRAILKKKHFGVFEHASMSVVAVTSRAVSHELVRHRIASYLQESQRYVPYDSAVPILYSEALRTYISYEDAKNIAEVLDAYATHLATSDPYDLSLSKQKRGFVEDIEQAYLAANMPRHSIGGSILDKFFESYIVAANNYAALRRFSVAPEAARGILPNDAATKILVTMNLASWRHFLSVRAFDNTGRAAPDMHVLADGILRAAIDYEDQSLHKLLLMEQETHRTPSDSGLSPLFNREYY